MLIQGCSSLSRMSKLVEYYTSLLQKGVSASNILVLCLNSYKKSCFIDSFKKSANISFYENPKIYTFYGFVYNTLLDKWPLIENTLSVGTGIISPNLTGLELSELFFKSAIKEVDFRDYNSKINLIHQLFRRYSLIVNNDLSPSDVKKRSTILSESFADDAQKAIDIYKKKTLEFRAFDYIRQLSLFDYIVNNSDSLNKIQYLILDDADEITQFEFNLIKKMYPKLKGVCVAYDKYGPSRMGFLNSDTETVVRLVELFKNENSCDIDDFDYSLIKSNIKNYSRRLEMVNASLNDVVNLLKQGVKPSEISIITPNIDKSFKFSVSEILEKDGVLVQYLSGSEKLVSNPLVKNIITILKMSLGLKVDSFSYREVLSSVLKIPIKYCMQVVAEYRDYNSVVDTGLVYESHKESIAIFLSVLEKISNINSPLSERIFYILENLLKLDETDYSKMNTFTFFVKQIQDFEQVFNKYQKEESFLKSFLIQLENSIISENASDSTEIKEDRIVVSTVQKIIDFSYKTKYQFWLDITSDSWIRDDLGTIYNAWVMQNSWNKDSFEYEDNLCLSALKTKCQLRKLALLGENVTAYSSLFDIDGNENIGGIESYFEEVIAEQLDTSNYQFKPRDDQKPVLAYKGGKMAISAVPGAGKTTVLLALIIKLLGDGVNSENIFVLTYMDSAAKNFKERIKIALPTLDRMPNISTIHGLALRILKENMNYLKIGLDANFEVCDDSARQKIIREIMLNLKFEQDDYDKYEKGISALKLSGLKKTPFVQDFELRKFLRLYENYNSALKSLNVIDYDDMLYYSVNILETDSSVRDYYCNICKYLIEDEAQDSSFIQQRLLNLLCGKHGNLVRCGDINQSITTTFTNTDLQGFRDFVHSSMSVLMNKSQRCAYEIFSFANDIVKYALSKDNLKNAFFDIEMQCVSGKNPVAKNPVVLKLFDDYREEQQFIADKIREVFRENSDATVAILVRNNFQIEDYSRFLSEAGYSVITKNDYLMNQPVFVLISHIIQFCVRPWDNDFVLKIVETMRAQSLFAFSPDDIEYLKNLSIPFILCDESNIKLKSLLQLHWDLIYWLNCISVDIESFALKVGSYYYNTEVEKSNVYLVALFLKNLLSQYKDIDLFAEKLQEVAQKPILSKYRFFDDMTVTNQSRGSVQIMTYHKSKGDEFDCVFVPQLSEEYLPFDVSNIKIKSKERFLESVKALNKNYKKKDESELQKFIVEENLRLLYVAVTRAKRKLYLTCAHKYKKFSKLKDAKPSILFDDFLSKYGVENERG